MAKTPKRSGDIADGETGEGERTPPTSGAGVANALDRWDEEGGAPGRLYGARDCEDWLLLWLRIWQVERPQSHPSA
jgi:hypothetical protein